MPNITNHDESALIEQINNLTDSEKIKFMKILKESESNEHSSAQKVVNSVNAIKENSFESGSSNNMIVNGFKLVGGFWSGVARNIGGLLNLRNLSNKQNSSNSQTDNNVLNDLANSVKELNEKINQSNSEKSVINQSGGNQSGGCVECGCSDSSNQTKKEKKNKKKNKKKNTNEVNKKKKNKKSKSKSTSKSKNKSLKKKQTRGNKKSVKMKN